MNIAFIPVRGGSKSIPLKNIRKIAGHPLVYWTTKAASECKQIDKVYVATDSDIIKTVVEEFKLDKVEVIGRSADTASDTATTESAMLEFAEQYTFDNIVLVQATSPLIQAEDLERGFDIFKQQDTDSVLSVVRQKRFHWAVDKKGLASPTNYDVFHRPRRQEFDGYLVENGAFYITGRKELLESRNRVSGNIHVCEMDESTYFEIDEPSDWAIIEKQLEHRLKKNTEKVDLNEIKLFLTDCDGCLTDGGMYYSNAGDEMKRFNTLDGMGIQLLRQQGVLTGIITGENTMLNQRRGDKLHLDILKQGIKDKLQTVKQICEEYHIGLSEVAYIGDDINDLEVIEQVGFGCSVANGMDQVKNAAKYVTERRGGDGAVREVADLILKSITERE